MHFWIRKFIPDHVPKYILHGVNLMESGKRSRSLSDLISTHFVALDRLCKLDFQRLWWARVEGGEAGELTLIRSRCQFGAGGGAPRLHPACSYVTGRRGFFHSEQAPPLPKLRTCHRNTLNRLSDWGVATISSTKLGFVKCGQRSRQIWYAEFFSFVRKPRAMTSFFFLLFSPCSTKAAQQVFTWKEQHVVFHKNKAMPRRTSHPRVTFIFAFQGLLW